MKRKAHPLYYSAEPMTPKTAKRELANASNDEDKIRLWFLAYPKVAFTAEVLSVDGIVLAHARRIVTALETEGFIEVVGKSAGSKGHPINSYKLYGGGEA